MRFNDILRGEGLEPAKVAVVLHTPVEPKLRRLLPMLVRERPEVFEAYQSTHTSTATATLRVRRIVASFVDTGDRSLVLAGIYQHDGPRDRARAEIGRESAIRALIAEFGAYAEFENAAEGHWPWFDLKPTSHLAEFVGRLRIAPRLTRNYVRLAENLDAKVVAIERTSALDIPAPDWREMMPTGPELRVLPQAWRVRLREWRGIYLIVDQSDGGRYVGSAYGDANNLLGRWMEHVAGERGVTTELRKRDPKQFRFSILERVSPDLPADEVIRLERSWMDRLDTIRHGLNT
jgi:hypothetical protein